MKELKVGRPEILTEGAAKKICKVIERMPDAGIPVTWGNVIDQTKKLLGIDIKRGTLSQKEWGGRKLISEAYALACSVQKGKHADLAPKYGTASRAVLQRRIADLEALNFALREQLDRVRAIQVREIDAFLLTPSDLRKVLLKSHVELQANDTSAAVTEIKK